MSGQKVTGLSQVFKMKNIEGPLVYVDESVSRCTQIYTIMRLTCNGHIQGVFF